MRKLFATWPRTIIVSLAVLLTTWGIARAVDNYAATAGSGLTFAAKLVSAVLYPQFLISDPTTPAQIAKVDTNGNLNVIAGAVAGQTASTTTGSLIQCDGLSADQTAVTTGQTQNVACELGGQLIVRQGAVEGRRVRGGSSATDTSAITILAASGSASFKEYITDLECGNTSATTTIVTLNDGATTKLVVPAGGGNNKTFSTPLVVAANTAATATALAGVTTMYCYAQGYYAP